MTILEIYKNSKKLYEQQSNKKWKINFKVSELTGKKIGFIGTGTLATESAKRLQGFEVEIWGVNTSGHDKEYFDKGVERFEKECKGITRINDNTKIQQLQLFE